MNKLSLVKDANDHRLQTEVIQGKIFLDTDKYPCSDKGKQEVNSILPIQLDTLAISMTQHLIRQMKCYPRILWVNEWTRDNQGTAEIGLCIRV